MLQFLYEINEFVHVGYPKLGLELNKIIVLQEFSDDKHDVTQRASLLADCAEIQYNNVEFPQLYLCKIW